MKKFLSLAFLSVAMIAAVSCSKDDDKKTDSPSIKGTLWEADVNYTNVPVLGSGTLQLELFFKNETLCRVDADLPAGIQMALAALGIGNLQPGDYPYTFDGTKVTIQIGGSNFELDYTGNTLVFHIPDQYSAVVTYLGGPDVVFNKQ